MELISTTPPIILTKSFAYPIIPNAYLEWIAEDHSADTVRTYAYALVRWLSWCEGKRIDWKTVSEDQIRAFRNSLGMSNRSINYEIRRIVAFYDFAARRGVPSPIERLVRPVNVLKIRKAVAVRNIRLVSQEEVGRFIRGFTHARDRRIAEVMYLCGLRRSEVLGLRKSMLEGVVDGNSLAMIVRGKGDVEREVEMSLALRDDLLEHAKDSKGPYVFNLRGGAIHPSTVEKAFAANRKRTGVKIHCHLLRHLYATHRLRALEQQFKGGSGLNSALKLLQMELGHANIATTSLYLHLADTEEASQSLTTWQDSQMRAIRAHGGAK